MCGPIIRGGAAPISPDGTLLSNYKASCDLTITICAPDQPHDEDKDKNEDPYKDDNEDKDRYNLN